MLFFFFFSCRLGPCEIPLSDQWISHTQLSQASQLSNQTTNNTALLSPVAGNTPNQLVNTQQQQLQLPASQQQHQQHQQQSQQQQLPTTIQSQAKIMNAVVSNVACPPAASKKIRRKSENKVCLRVHIY